MHGVYTYRKSLETEGYYDKLASVGETISESGTTERDTFIYYCAAVMDFDRALGEIYDYLENKGLLDNTIIALFGDHNAYYQSLSEYVKDTDDTSLYVIPSMIRCPGMEHSIISKFTCTADIMPTICDLLGINLYGNLYYGHSAFAEEESVLYSRAYSVFMTDHIMFYTMNRIIWSDEACTDEYMKSLISRSYKLVDKTTACDQIFYSDYFAGEGKAEMYKEKMLEINGH
jgi:phosphoglycerol transferase MdoB-like AlkP superfamily enzyme